ncbi:MAG: hypothetical protein QOH11_2137, partial [Solirubrobacteraceae bacterium]|nr:hypothetical protein [Solirubrobacteraceae bacterium]
RRAPVLHRFLSRLTYANIVATVAVFLALGGGAYALSGIPDSGGVYHGCVASSGALRVVSKASSCLKARTVKRGSRRVRIPGESAIVWNQQGRPGVNGAQGPAGPQGFQGQQGQGIPGTPGSASASASFGGIQNFPTIAAGATVFTSPADDVQFPDSRNILTPNAAVTLRDLAVLSNGSNLPANVSLLFTLIGPSGEISCTIPTGSRSCNSGAQTATVPPASEVSLTIQNTGTASYGDSPSIEFGWRATG